MWKPVNAAQTYSSRRLSLGNFPSLSNSNNDVNQFDSRASRRMSLGSFGDSSDYPSFGPTEAHRRAPAVAAAVALATSKVRAAAARAVARSRPSSSASAASVFSAVSAPASVARSSDFSVAEAEEEEVVDRVEETVPPPRHSGGRRVGAPRGTRDDDDDDAHSGGGGGGGAVGVGGGGDDGGGDSGGGGSGDHAANAAVVIVPYTARMEDELTLTPGQAIQLLDEADDGWVLGRCTRTGDEGWFHGSFVERNTSATFCAATRRFNADETPGALSLTHGERLRVLHQGASWWLVMRGPKRDGGDPDVG